jgi:hypothetical protein
MRGGAARRRDRYLSMAEVATLLPPPKPKEDGQPHDPAYLRQRVWRLIRRLERRDRTTYLRTFGEGENAKLWVAVSALEQLMPWDPGTLTALRGDLDALGTRTKRLERRVDQQQNDIANLSKWTKEFAEIIGRHPKLREAK